MMLLVAGISGAIQVVIMNKNVEENVLREAASISTSIQQGIKETELAAKEIEHQIDLKMESYSKYIEENLNGRPLSEITNDELVQIRDEIGIAGITLFERTENDIVGVRSSDPNEIGFSIREANPYGFEMINRFMDGNLTEEMKQSISFITDESAILYTTQSGSHEGTPMFYKYAYHQVPGTDYLIDPYIEANEVYQFIQKVGPDSWIGKVKESNEYAQEIAVLDPRVFADPSLAENMYPPLQKIVNGTFDLADERDTQLLTEMLKVKEEQSYIEAYDGKEIYKTFIPMEDGNVIYIALNYEKMKEPFYRNALILILTGFFALAALFVLTTSFFNRIYSTIHKIIIQILRLEQGDFTAKSEVKDNGELGRLSDSTNKMADSLNEVLGETKDQAIETERHAYLLESEANNSVDKVYSMSMEATTTDRETSDEIDYILDQFQKIHENSKDDNTEIILEKIEEMRVLVRSRTNSTTEMTITLSDLLKSLYQQSASLSDISKKLLKNMERFKISSDEKVKDFDDQRSDQ